MAFLADKKPVVAVAHRFFFLVEPILRLINF
jgi:hypothetical protein